MSLKDYFWRKKNQGPLKEKAGPVYILVDPKLTIAYVPMLLFF